MKKILLALVVAGMSMGVMAQTEDYPVKKHSVQTNGFWENWFVTAGYAGQVVVMDRVEGVGLFDTYSSNASIAVGKWFTPGLGLRLQTFLPSYYDEFGEKGKAYSLYGEALFNLTNMLGGYKQDRFYSAVPYVGFGRLWGDECVWSPWVLGYMSKFRINNSFSIDLELYLRQQNHMVQTTWYNWQAGAMLGLTWNIGGRGFDASPDMAAVAAIHSAQLAGLNEALAAEQNENKNLKEQLAKKPKEVIVEKIVKEVLAAPQSVFFSFNSAKIASKKEIINLESLANMAKNNGAKLKITGYADSATGVPAYNQQLSERRAQAVAKELIKMGVAEENIVIEAKGGVADINPASYNRRVIIEAL
jgi:outer membrane protein OmpA-like peptidoglycan-associated protein